MNKNNLIPMNQRTKNEQREITRKGGIKSGESRRKRKQVKQIITELLAAEPDPLSTIGMIDIPFGGELTNAAILVKALYDKAKQGDVRAFETIMKYAGEDPDQKRKDAELKLKREALKLQREQFDNDNEIYEPVKIVYDIPDNGQGNG